MYSFGFTLQLSSAHPERTPGRPVARLECPAAFHQSPGGRQQETHSQLGSGISEDPGGVAHSHAPLPQTADVWTADTESEEDKLTYKVDTFDISE